MSKTKTEQTKANTLPELETAEKELFRRHLRAVVWLGVRIVGVGIFTAIMVAQIPSLAKHRLWLDMASGILVLAPFFTALGKNYAYRIALGRSYVKESQFADAERTLSVFENFRAAIFDAAGEGRYHLAEARHGLGKTEAARPLWETIAVQGAEPFRSQAREALTRGEGTAI